MSELTLEQYWEFHTDIHLRIAKNNGTSLWLKKFIPQFENGIQQDIYGLYMPEPDVSAKNNEEWKVEITSYADLKKEIEINNLKFDELLINVIGCKGFEYDEMVLKVGNKDQILYCLNHISEIQLRFDSDGFSYYMLSIENLIKQMVIHPEGIEILLDFCVNKKLSEQNVSTQVEMKKMLKNHFKEKISHFNNLFEMIGDVKNEQKIVQMLDHDFIHKKNLSFSLWLDTIPNKKSAIVIIGKHLKNIHINEQPNDIQVKVRDCLIKNFPHDLHKFSWVTLLQKNKKSAFSSNDTNTFFSITIDVDDLQKNVPLPDTTIHVYCLMLNVLRKSLLKVSELGIEEIYEKTMTNTDKSNRWVVFNNQQYQPVNQFNEKSHQIKEQWIVSLNEQSLLTKAKLENLIMDSLNNYMVNIIGKSPNQTPEDEISQIVEDNLNKWIASYWLRQELNNGLEIKAMTNKPKM